MPSRNSIKLYAENSYYHVYNRGIDKKDIFIDKNDYVVFKNLMKRYLVPPLEEERDNKFESNRIRYRTDLHSKIELISYCLMPNHFHLMIRQATKNAITDFMRALSNSYVIYFNSKYNRTGPLFTGKYKAVLVEGESYLLHLTRYIHLNPLDLGYARSDLVNYSYSSLGSYLGKDKVDWIHPEEILSFFKNSDSRFLGDILSYQSFVEDYPSSSEDILVDLTLE